MSQIRLVGNVKHLRRLEIFLDVVYALLFFNMVRYLPSLESMKWVGSEWGVLQPLVDNPAEITRIFIGIGLTLIYWNLNNKLLGRVVRTNQTHAVLALSQMVFVCLYMYFAISDPDLAGGPSSPAAQAISLAIAGFIGAYGWRYACRHDLVDPEMTAAERRKLALEVLTEPLTAVINTPVAWIGPLVWTLGWFTIPFGVMAVIKWLKRE